MTPQPALRRILIIKPSSLGDIVHALPVAAAIKQAHPNCELRWITQPEWAGILQGSPAVDDLIFFPRTSFRGPFGALSAIPWLRSLDHWIPDIVIDLQGLFRSGLMAMATRASWRIGLSDAREGAALFYTHSAAVTSAMHSVERYLRVLPLLDIPLPESPDFALPSGTCPGAFQAEPPYILLHPFSRGSGKSLTPQQTARLIQDLSPHRVILAGRCPASVRDTFPAEGNLLNRTTLPELIWLLRHATLTISVDSGPMHIASAVSPRLLSIHTWSNPLSVGPWSNDAHVWRNGRIHTMRELRAHSEKSSGRPLRDEDIPAIAAWARDIL